MLQMAQIVAMQAAENLGRYARAMEGGVDPGDLQERAWEADWAAFMAAKETAPSFGFLLDQLDEDLQGLVREMLSEQMADHLATEAEAMLADTEDTEADGAGPPANTH